MQISFKFREVLGRTPYLVDELENIAACISGSFRVEHNPDGTHADITANSITTGNITVTGDLSVGGYVDTLDFGDADNSIDLDGGTLEGEEDVSSYPSIGTTADIIIPVLRSERHIVPSADDAENLGWISGEAGQDRRWRNILFSRTVYGPVVAATSALYAGETPFPVDAKLHVYGASAVNPLVVFERALNTQTAALRWATGGTNDWNVGLRATTDSDFHIFSFGTSADAVTIARATGLVTIANGLSITNGVFQVSRDTTGNQIATFNCDQADGGYIQFLRSSVTKGYIGTARSIQGSGWSADDFMVYAGSNLRLIAPGGYTAIEGAVCAPSVISPAALSAGNNNNWAPTGFATTTIIRVTCAGGGSTLTGIAGGVAGRIIVLTNLVGADPLTISEEDAASTAANRFWSPSGASASYNLTSRAFIYDGTASRWVALN